MVNAKVSESEKREIKRRLIRTYDSFVIRAYCFVRFVIMNMRILEELEQYLPAEGVVLDVGCGFGLFSLYFASCAPERRMIGFDINPGRIATARRATSRLGLNSQVIFQISDIAEYGFTVPVDAIILLDLMHHIPEETALRTLRHFHNILHDDGVLVIKDVTARPRLKMAFTWLLDKLVDFRAPLRYYTRDEMIAIIEATGFEVKFHHLPDILPYPHIMYICQRR
jgi:cyclopropane fatty-acyl-phospholipid synthase-like methyltransferase